MDIVLKTYNEVLHELILRFRKRRLDMNLTQVGLADRAGLSVGAVKHFEKTGKTTLDKFLKLAAVLGSLGDFDNILASHIIRPTNLFEDMVTKNRKRGKLK
jgi:transcriptional regulator with XRE-family HTH domain